MCGYFVKSPKILCFSDAFPPLVEDYRTGGWMGLGSQSLSTMNGAKGPAPPPSIDLVKAVAGGKTGDRGRN